MPSFSRCLLILITILFGAILARWLVPLEQAAVKIHLEGFPDSDFFYHQMRPWIIAFLCFLPAIAAFFYGLGKTFDRYLARQFLSIFLICLGALFGLWLVADLSDNFSDFNGSNHLFFAIVSYYGYRLPGILLLILPYALLLALLYGLGKFSKSNEIIAMVQSGSSMLRISFPIIFAGLWCSILLLGLNYQWAPHAEGKRDELIARSKGAAIYEAKNVLYRDPYSQRLWLVGAFPEDFQKGGELLQVEVTTLHPDSSLKSRICSPRVTWNKQTREWTFEEPVITTFSPGESPFFESIKGDLVIKDWKETPSQIIKPGLQVEHLGIPEISSWLRSPLAHQSTANRSAYLTHWHYRWALPFSCLVTVLLAAPLAINFTRRGGASGVFVAILLSVLMIFFSSIALSLGEAEIIAPAMAAWLPNLGFTLLGIWLYHRRMSGLPIHQIFKRILSIHSSL